MSPLMREVLAQKEARRKRLASLPYPEKVRIVVRLREAALRIKAASAKAGLITPLRRL